MAIRPENGNRTHEPSLRELTAELDGLREVLISKIDALKERMDDRDKVYRERDTDRKVAVDAALAAADRQTKASFEASEKAIVKAEEAQKAYNSAHNDLARKMDEQNKATMPRSETETRFSAIAEKVEEIRRTLAQGSGARDGGRMIKDETRGNIAIVVSVIGVLIALLMAAASFFVRSSVGVAP